MLASLLQQVRHHWLSNVLSPRTNQTTMDRDKKTHAGLYTPNVAPHVELMR